MSGCKDCASSSRPTPFPGPRCATCHRLEKKRRSKAAHERRVADVYGLGPGDYDRLYAAQGGRCAICTKATGKSRRLAVDHDHRCSQGHAASSACRSCVRGLLCSPCNKDVLGRLDAEALQRAYWYLVDPPAQRVLAVP